MEMLHELQFLGRSLRYFLLLFLLVTWSLFTLGTPTIPQRVFDRVATDMLPTGVVVVGVSPLSAVTVEVTLSLVFALLLLAPAILLWVVDYVSVALTPRERRAARGVIVPAVVLFIAGALFGYKVLLPETFTTLYAHTPLLGIQPYFLAEQFVSTILLFLGVSGTLFLIPVVMPMLSYLGLVSSRVWTSGWRFAVLLTLILSAVLTTDGSGVTMMLFSGPTVASYFVGLGISHLVSS